MKFVLCLVSILFILFHECVFLCSQKCEYRQINFKKYFLFSLYSDTELYRCVQFKSENMNFPRWCWKSQAFLNRKRVQASRSTFIYYMHNNLSYFQFFFHIYSINVRKKSFYYNSNYFDIKYRRLQIRVQ